MFCLSVGLLIWAEWFRRDQAPEFLRRLGLESFERSGFCCSLTVEAKDGQAVVSVFFQNRYSGAVEAAVVLQPSRSFLLKKSELPTLQIPVNCPPGGFGVAQVRLGIPAELHGKDQCWLVAASVAFPAGKGQLLRNRDGMAVGDAQTENRNRALLIAAGALTGTLVIASRASITLRLPVLVAVSDPDRFDCESTVLWELGDSDIDSEIESITSRTTLLLK